MKSRVLLPVLILVLTLGAGYILFKMPILALEFSEMKEGFILYDALESFFETELSVIGDNLKNFDPFYLVWVSGYLLPCALVLALLVSIIATLLDRRFTKILKIFVGIILLVLAGAGIYGAVKMMGDEYLLKASTGAFIYYALGVVGALLLILFKPRNKEK